MTLTFSPHSHPTPVPLHETLDLGEIVGKTTPKVKCQGRGSFGDAHFIVLNLRTKYTLSSTRLGWGTHWVRPKDRVVWQADLFGSPIPDHRKKERKKVNGPMSKFFYHLGLPQSVTSLLKKESLHCVKSHSQTGRRCHYQRHTNQSLRRHLLLFTPTSPAPRCHRVPKTEQVSKLVHNR